MRTYLLALAGFVMLSGCNALPVTYEDGAHWALFENPVAHKCVTITVGKGKLSVGGLVSWIGDVTVDGENVEYQSIGKMCQFKQEDNTVTVNRDGIVTVDTPE